MPESISALYRTDGPLNYSANPIYEEVNDDGNPMLYTQSGAAPIMNLEGEPDSEENITVWRYMVTEDDDDRRSVSSLRYNTGSPTAREEREMQARLEAEVIQDGPDPWHGQEMPKRWREAPLSGQQAWQNYTPSAPQPQAPRSSTEPTQPGIGPSRMAETNPGGARQGGGSSAWVTGDEPAYNPYVGNAPPYVEGHTFWSPDQANGPPATSGKPAQRWPSSMYASDRALPSGSLLAQARQEARDFMDAEQPHHHARFERPGGPVMPSPNHHIEMSAPPADRGIEPFVGAVRFEQCRLPEYVAVPLKHRPTPYSGIAEINETNLIAEQQKQRRLQERQQQPSGDYNPWTETQPDVLTGSADTDDSWICLETDPHCHL